MLDHWVFSAELKAEPENAILRLDVNGIKEQKATLSVEFYIRFLDVVTF